MNPEQKAWLAEQDTSSTGDTRLDYLIVQSISRRFFQQFPTARTFVVPADLQAGADLLPADG